MSVTIPSLDPVTDILDTDKIMVTQSSGQTYTIDGASFNKRNQAVIANSTTLTGASLKTGNIVRAYFTADITGVNTTTGLVLNYNGSNKNVKVPKDGALVNFTAQNMGGSPTVYKYLQAYTTLELLYDGTNFVIIGNPVVISSADYTIYADGKRDSYISYTGLTLIEENTIRDSTVTGTFTPAKNCLVSLSNSGTNESTNQLAWGRIICDNIIIASYSTTTFGAGTTVFIPAGKTITYSLKLNNVIVSMQIRYKYL